MQFENSHHFVGRHHGQFLHDSDDHFQGGRAERLRLGNFLVIFQTIFHVETNGIPDIFQNPLVGVTLGITSLKLRTESEITLFILFDHHGESIDSRVYSPPQQIDQQSILILRPSLPSAHHHRAKPILSLDRPPGPPEQSTQHHTPSGCSTPLPPSPPTQSLPAEDSEKASSGTLPEFVKIWILATTSAHSGRRHVLFLTFFPE